MTSLCAIDLVTLLCAIDLVTPLCAIDLVTPLCAIDLVTPLCAIDLVTPLCAIDLVTPLCAIDLWYFSLNNLKEHSALTRSSVKARAFPGIPFTSRVTHSLRSWTLNFITSCGN